MNFNHDKNKFRTIIFSVAAVCFGLFLALSANAAAGNSGYTLIWPGAATATCGTSAYMSSNASAYGNSTAVTVGNHVFTIKRMSDNVTVNTYTSTSASGPGCFNNCTYYYIVDITGNATYPNFYNAFDNYPSCGTSAKRVYGRVYLPTLAQGDDYRQIFPVNQWINYDPQFQVQLVNYPATITEPGGVTYTLGSGVMILTRDTIGGVTTDKTYTYATGKATYTLPVRGLADGQHNWMLNFYVRTNTGSYVPSGRTLTQWFGIDRVVPVVNSYSVSPAIPNGIQNVTVTAAATDVSSGMGSMRIYVDAVLKKTCALAGETTQVSCSIDVGALSAGNHTYYTSVTDRAGNMTTAVTKTFTVTAAPTVTVAVSASPASGTAPLSSSVTATVGGTAIGDIQYNIWWNCNNACATVAACTTACGAVNASITQAGAVYTLSNSYAAAGTYYPRVVAVRQTVSAANTATVTVAVPTVGATFSVSPTSGVTPLSVNLRAYSFTGTATGNIDYYYWWNCNSACATQAACVTACGAANASYLGQASTDRTETHVYSTGGTYYSRMAVVRQGASAAGGNTVTVTSTVTANFSVSPTSGTTPLSVNLRTYGFGGTATGNIDYYYWWNCNSACATQAACVTACGAANASYLGQASTDRTEAHVYAAGGTFYPRTAVVRQGASTAGGGTVTVTPTLTANFSVSPTSGTVPLTVDITASNYGGTATGAMDFIFWRDCDSVCATQAACTTACGSAVSSQSSAIPDPSYTKTYVYNTGGTFHPRLVIQRQGVSAAGGGEVTVSVANQAPVASALTATQPANYCGVSPSAIFTWNYSDAEGQPQSAYRVQIIDSSKADFSLPSIDSGKIMLSNASWATAVGQLVYGQSYRWRVMVWDDQDLASAWVEGTGFSTPAHKYPTAAFSRSPNTPTIEDMVIFTDASEDFSSGGIQSWSWTFANGVPASSSDQNPEVKFFAIGNNNVVLTVTDSTGYVCSITKVVKSSRRLPEWREISLYQ